VCGLIILPLHALEFILLAEVIKEFFGDNVPEATGGAAVSTIKIHYLAKFFVRFASPQLG